jgi:hypothetical protein
VKVNESSKPILTRKVNVVTTLKYPTGMLQNASVLEHSKSNIGDEIRNTAN